MDLPLFAIFWRYDPHLNVGQKAPDTKCFYVYSIDLSRQILSGVYINGKKRRGDTHFRK